LTAIRPALWPPGPAWLQISGFKPASKQSDPAPQRRCGGRGLRRSGVGASSRSGCSHKAAWRLVPYTCRHIERGATRAEPPSRQGPKPGVPPPPLRPRRVPIEPSPRPAPRARMSAVPRCRRWGERSPRPAQCQERAFGPSWATSHSQGVRRGSSLRLHNPYGGLHESLGSQGRDAASSDGNSQY